MIGKEITFQDIVVGARFFRAVPSFLRHPVDLAQTKKTISRRLENRAADFLSLMRQAVYGNPRSPYGFLLRIAGCEYGDLEKLVETEGVEGTLRRLLHAGVYLSVKEFRGRSPIKRGSTVLDVAPAQFLNPLSRPHVPTQTGRSRSQGILVPVDLAYVRDTGINKGVFLEACGGLDWVHAEWAVPGSAVMVHLLEYSSFGLRQRRWFSQVEPDAPALHPRYVWSARVMRWGSLIAGFPLPAPECAPVDHPESILKWMADVLRNGNTPHLATYPTSAVRLCQAALSSNTDLAGARFTLNGEPSTPSRLDWIRKAGASAYQNYGSRECGVIGLSCLRPGAADDVHLFFDLHALIQTEGRNEIHGMPAGANLISSLRPAAPLVLLNVSLGDTAVLSSRDCGCPLGKLGLTTHLHSIRSYEKLTAMGMNFLDADVIHVLEEVLPERFGGAPTDYQLVEREGSDGLPRLELWIHPAVGSVDALEVKETFFSAISAGSGVERLTAILWQNGKILQVERRVPLATPSGKIHHLHAGPKDF